ncbi:MAG: transposase [Methylocella sp.]
MSRTGESTASCPSRARLAAVRFDSSRARVSNISMSLAIRDKRLNLALVRLRPTPGIEHFAGEEYLSGSVLEWKARKQPERRLDGKAASKSSSRARTVTARNQPKPIHQLTTAQFELTFPNEDACCAYLIGRRWPVGLRCPHCDAEVSRPSGLDNATAQAVRRMRAGDHLSLFPHRWNYFREYE